MNTETSKAHAETHSLKPPMSRVVRMRGVSVLGRQSMSDTVVQSVHEKLCICLANSISRKICRCHEYYLEENLRDLLDE